MITFCASRAAEWIKSVGICTLRPKDHPVALFAPWKLWVDGLQHCGLYPFTSTSKAMSTSYASGQNIIKNRPSQTDYVGNDRP